MKKDKIIRGMVIVFLCSVNICGLEAQEKAGECVPTDLKCEHLVAPLGIDRQAPRFSWHLEDSRGGAVQTAYRITVGKDSVALSKGKKILWQEKKADGKTMAGYKGKALEPFTKYYWSVTVWDKDKQESRKVISSFETGMLTPSNWEGTFISDGQDIESRETPYFRKAIRLD